MKPRSLRVIGVLLIIAALFSIASGVLAFVMADKTEIGESFKLYPSEYDNLLNIYGFTYSIVLLIASIQFLRLVKWARSLLEVLTWMYIIQQATICVLYVNLLLKKKGELVPSEWAVLAAVIMTLIYISGIVIALIILKYLRSDKIRNAMESSISSAPTI
ncbi:MAG TPA: hypothetical protein VHP63_08345 [candidate division Zixibacteria bacterium]|nr:hypothetical protein [candidate division Zixibacteria bacterium]